MVMKMIYMGVLLVNAKKNILFALKLNVIKTVLMDMLKMLRDVLLVNVNLNARVDQYLVFFYAFMVIL
jgi:inner membrane protein involved in colicin E2 resistance